LIDAVACLIEQPAVVGAPDSLRLRYSVRKVGLSVWAGRFYKPEFTHRTPEEDKVFA
jgi:hypothetical protein